MMILLGFGLLLLFIMNLYIKIRDCCSNRGEESQRSTYQNLKDMKNKRDGYNIRKRPYASGVNPATKQPYTVDNKAYYVPKVEYAKDHHIKNKVDMYRGVDLGEINADIENKTYDANWLDVVDGQRSSYVSGSSMKFQEDYIAGGDDRDDNDDDNDGGDDRECYDGCALEPTNREGIILSNPSGVADPMQPKIPLIPTGPQNVNPWRYKEAPIYEMYDVSPELLEKVKDRIQELENKLNVYAESEKDAPKPPPQYLQIVESRPMSWAPNKNPIYYPHLRRELPY